MANLVVFVIILALSFPLHLLDGWALSILWGWYGVPLGLPAISVVHGVGISLMMAQLTHQQRAPKEDQSDKERYIEAFSLLIHGALLALLILFVGWIFHFYM